MRRRNAALPRDPSLISSFDFRASNLEFPVSDFQFSASDSGPGLRTVFMTNPIIHVENLGKRYRSREPACLRHTNYV